MQIEFDDGTLLLRDSLDCMPHAEWDDRVVDLFDSDIVAELFGQPLSQTVVRAIKVDPECRILRRLSGGWFLNRLGFYVELVAFHHSGIDDRLWPVLNIRVGIDALRSSTEVAHSNCSF
jgi:hypothetical protein